MKISAKTASELADAYDAEHARAVVEVLCDIIHDVAQEGNRHLYPVTCASAMFGDTSLLHPFSLQPEVPFTRLQNNVTNILSRPEYGFVVSIDNEGGCDNPLFKISW